jgi:hypothetical protein
MISVTNVCPACGHELKQKSRPTLTLVGIVMVVAAVPLLFRSYYWIIAILMAATGLYLLIWSIFGKGKWCHRCKKFPVSKSLVG